MERDSEEGMSLIDLMVGAFVGLVLIGAVLSIVVHQGRMRQANTESGLAQAAVANTLERLRSLDEAEIATMHATGFDVPGANGQPGGLRAVPADLDGLPGELRVYALTSGTGIRMYHVTAVVDWVGVSGRRNYAFRTLVTDRR